MKRLISMLTSFVIWLALGGSAVAALAQAPGYANSAENNTFTIYLTALTFALGLGFIDVHFQKRAEREVFSKLHNLHCHQGRIISTSSDRYT